MGAFFLVIELERGGSLTNGINPSHDNINFFLSRKGVNSSFYRALPYALYYFLLVKIFHI